MNVESDAIGPTFSDSEIALLPFHAPDAVHALAFELDQVRVEKPLAETARGSALIVTDGAAGGAAGSGIGEPDGEKLLVSEPEQAANNRLTALSAAGMTTQVRQLLLRIRYRILVGELIFAARGGQSARRPP